VTAWITSVLLALATALYPRTPVPDLRELARAIDVAAHKTPLPGEDGVVEMAVELSVLAATEGHLRADAVGVDFYGTSMGAWQIHETTLGYLGATREDTFDLEVAARLAAKLVKKSHEVCRARAWEERLAWFASGGPTCSVTEGLAASRRRMRLAEWVQASHPAYWTEANR